MVVKDEQLSVLSLPGRDLRLVIDPKTAGTGNITVIITEIPPGCELPVHTHKVGEEIMHFLAGTAETECDGEKIVVKPGDTFDVPEGATHTVRNVGSDTVRMFCVFNPPIDTTPFAKAAQEAGAAQK